MGTTVDLNDKRNERAAGVYRLLQIEALLELFKREHDGRPANTTNELESWYEEADLPPERIAREVRLKRENR